MRHSRASFVAAHRNPHQLLQMAMVTVFNFYADVMHCKYLGTDEYYDASVLWLLVWNILPGSSVDAG